jgi:hypothetical protein
MKYVRNLLKHLRPDTEERVAGAYNRYNRLVRQSIRNETGLSLVPRGLEGEESETKVKIIVDEVGLPEKVANIPIKDSEWMAALLSIYKPYLNMLKNSAAQVSELLLMPELKKLPEVKKRGTTVPEAHKLADALLTRIKLFDLAKRILAIDEDVLGIYEYDLQDRAPSKIILYWGAIGLVSQDLGLDLESLTASILAHELAHAYTHLGFDIDDRRWPTLSFHKSQTQVTEGLAQYYTARVMERLRDRLPLGWETYKKLLTKQPPPYHAHEPWIKGFTPEVVRATLISGRGETPLQIKPFNEELVAMAPRFRRRPSMKV